MSICGRGQIPLPFLFRAILLARTIAVSDVILMEEFIPLTPMKKILCRTFCIIPEMLSVILIFPAVMILCSGCRGISSDVYRKGAVGYSYRSQSVAGKPDIADKLSIAVQVFSESRSSRREKQTLWACPFPLLSFAAFWENPHWLLWDDEFYSSYKPLGEDMAEIFRRELECKKLFRVVLSGKRDDEADLVLSGDISELTLTERPHCNGAGFIIGQFLGLAGLPFGNWEIRQDLSLVLSQRASGNVLWRKIFKTEAKGVSALYYGRDPLKNGYPSDQLFEPVVRQALNEIEYFFTGNGADFQLTLLPTATHLPIIKPVPPGPRHPSLPLNAASTALVVGISDYSFIGDIEGCTEDASRVADTVRDVCGLPATNLALINDSGIGASSPSRGTIEERLGIAAREALPDGMLFVYLSGHGVVHDGKLQFLARDSRPGTGIDIDEVLAIMSSSKAGDKLLVLDICHAGAAQKGLAVMPAVEHKSDVAVLVSCSDREFSYPGDDCGSVYTNAFVESLRQLDEGGEAIDVLSLHQEIAKRIRLWRLEKGVIQTPNLQANDARAIFIRRHSTSGRR